jgi:RNA polymerase sigma-70 factor (ECF subfamily)
MLPEQTFIRLLRRVRAGDEQAAAELVRRYEPALHRLVRARLRDHRLRRTQDPGDVCQSVFAAFFARVTRGQYELGTAEDLRRLLAVMARNQVISEIRRWQVRARHLPEEVGGRAIDHLVCPGAPPGRQLEARDLLEAFRRRLGRQERWLADQRFLNRPWAEIAVECGDSPEALRKRLRRALARLAAEFQDDGRDRQPSPRPRR